MTRKDIDARTCPWCWGVGDLKPVKQKRAKWWRWKCDCGYECKYPIPKECDHEWHADQDNDCNFCVKCGATQEIYTE